MLKRNLHVVVLVFYSIVYFFFCSWTIDTKYYTADVCIWTARLDELDSKDSGSSPLEHCEALLMVFDLSDVRDTSLFHFLMHKLQVRCSY